MLSTLGGLAGGILGGPTGMALGSTAGNLVAQISGSGDYRVNSNTLVGSNPVMSFKSGGDGFEMTHEEFLGNVTGSTSFNLTSYPINPGMSDTFPWLSTVAVNFEEYDITGLVFRYKPSSGSAVSSTSSALGVVIMATDYDALNPSFSNKQQMESYEFSTSTVPFNGCIHPVECARNRNVLNSLYIRSGDPPAGSDLRMYDMGNFQIATEGMQSSYVIGELWVVYRLRLRKPRLPIGMLPSDTAAYAHIRESPDGQSIETQPFGPGEGKTSSASDEDIAHAISTNAVRLPSMGDYLVLTCCFTSTGLNPGFTIAPGPNIDPGPNLFGDNAVNSFGFGTANIWMNVATFTVNTSGETVANNLSWALPTGTYPSGTFDVFVFPLPPDPDKRKERRGGQAAALHPLEQLVNRLLDLRLKSSGLLKEEETKVQSSLREYLRTGPLDKEFCLLGTPDGPVQRRSVPLVTR